MAKSQKNSRSRRLRVGTGIQACFRGGVENWKLGHSLVIGKLVIGHFVERSTQNVEEPLPKLLHFTKLTTPMASLGGTGGRGPSASYCRDALTTHVEKCRLSNPRRSAAVIGFRI
jgi:hypothetical protein